MGVDAQNENQDETINKLPHERKYLNNTFDELTKSMAQSVTRRAAFKKFGIGLAGMALACFGLANKAEADPRKPSLGYCRNKCKYALFFNICVGQCLNSTSP
jgi:hypothetical protein